VTLPATATVPNPVVEQIYASGAVLTPSGESRPLHSAVLPSYGRALYDQVRAAKPTVILEVGMAYGLSSLAMLAALSDNGGDGRLISVDPVQTTDWEGIGLAAVERAGFAGRHQLVEDFDFNALPRLLADGTRVQFAYLDGWHTFDYTALDIFYADKMLEANGIMVLNDCGWKAVNKSIGYLTTHRRYAEIDAKLPKTFSGSPLDKLQARLTGRRSEDRYFRKLENWEPNWDFFARF
jgi:predicted O-methyltransferase YrrM